jgi:uncharacterized membrane protein YoaK (UPF0700 family)
MLLRLGPHRHARLDQRLGYSLAFIAGALNSAGFYSLGFFASNMTGNFSAGADEFALGDVLQGLVYLTLPVSFIIGAVLATLWTEIGVKRGVRRIYAISILCEAVLLLALGAIELMIPAARGSVLVIGLSVLMGFQNAVATRISLGRVRTTHVSGMSTDIGISIGLLTMIGLQKTADPERSAHLERLKLHALTVLAFCVGGILGVLVYKAVGAVLLFIAAALLAAIALPGILADGPALEADAED